MSLHCEAGWAEAANLTENKVGHWSPGGLVLWASLFSYPLYWFSTAPLTNSHKLGGLKQQKFVLSQFWGPRSEVKVLSVQAPAEGAFWRESLFWSLFQLLLAASLPGAL